MTNERRREMCVSVESRASRLRSLAEEKAELEATLEAFSKGDLERVPPWLTPEEALLETELLIERVETEIDQLTCP